jgi:hypothetical protein
MVRGFALGIKMKILFCHPECARAQKRLQWTRGAAELSEAKGRRLRNAQIKKRYFMYSKAEMQKLKHEFWIAFAKEYPRKWLLYDTKIKDFSFKFYVDNKKAQVMIDIEMRDDGKRIAYFEKIESLRSILEDEFINDSVFEKNLTLESGKTISRIWVEQLGISVSNRDTWHRIFDFFAKHMAAFEAIYAEYDDYIKDI